MIPNRLAGLIAFALPIAVLCVDVVLSQEQATVPAAIELGFEAGEGGKLVRPWLVPTQGWKAELVAEDASEGMRWAKLSLPKQSTARFGNLMRMIDAAPYRGLSVQLSAKIRIAGGDQGRAMMWLRVDRPDRKTGFFDNMSNRPIRSTTWTEAIIEGEIAADARQIAVGVMSKGEATVFVDEMRLSFSQAAPVQEASPPRALTTRGLENVAAAARLVSYIRFFHPSDQALEVTDWNSVAVQLIKAAEPAENPTQLADRLRDAISTIAPTVAVWAGDPGDAPETAPLGEHNRWLRYWIHHGAGSLASSARIYSSKLQHLPIGGEEPGATGNVLGAIRKALLGDDDDEPPPAAEIVKSLGGGVCCRLPVMVAVAEKRNPPRINTTRAAVVNGPASTAGPAAKLNVLNRSTRLAAVATCWGVMQHFYPYFDVVETDWDAALSTALSAAANDTDATTFLHTLQRLVAKLHDGHGSVFNRDMLSRARLPVSLDWSGKEPIVIGTHTTAPEPIEPGDVLVAIDGKSIQRWRQELSQRVSAATDGWRRRRLGDMLCTDTFQANPCPVRMRKPDGTAYQTQLPLCPLGTRIDSVLKKPSDGSELAPGIVYFDLHGASRDAWKEAHDQLREAKGIVFDLRGYPGDAAMSMLREVGDQPLSSARWNVPIVNLPDREGWTWRKTSWTLRPVEPKLSAEIAFLTNGGAISYAETIFGIVERYKLGEIVGGTTAGTNGNVNPFTLPGDYRVSWTGMKVLKHDGSQHHGVGITPTVPIEPTPEGIAAGRDEVLDKAVGVLLEKTKG